MLRRPTIQQACVEDGKAVAIAEYIYGPSFAHEPPHQRPSPTMRGSAQQGSMPSTREHAAKH